MLIPPRKVQAALLCSAVLASLSILILMTAFRSFQSAVALGVTLLGLSSVLAFGSGYLAWLILVRQLKAERRTQQRAQQQLFDNFVNTYTASIRLDLSTFADLVKSYQLDRKGFHQITTRLEHIEDDCRTTLREMQMGHTELLGLINNLELDITSSIQRNRETAKDILLSSSNLHEALMSTRQSIHDLDTIAESRHKKNMEAHNRVVRNVVAHIRKEASMSQILERLIAMERRILGILAAREDETMTEAGLRLDEVSSLIQHISSKIDSIAEDYAKYFKELNSSSLVGLKHLSKQISESTISLSGRIVDQTSALAYLNDNIFTIETSSQLVDTVNRSSSQLRALIEQTRAVVAKDIELAAGNITDCVSQLQQGLEGIQTHFDDVVSTQYNNLTTLTSENSQAAISGIKDAKETLSTESKNAFLRLTHFTERTTKRHAIDIVRQVEAVHQLLSCVKGSKPMPATGGWALTADTLLYLRDWILSNSPKKILEIGSGASSVWLGMAARDVGCKMISFEHSSKYAEVTTRLLDDFDLGNTVQLIYSPLEPLTVLEKQYSWYTLRSLEKIGGDFDLLVVDGPPESTGELARFPALPVLEPRLNRHATILLDDAQRPSEIEILRQWRGMYPEFRDETVALSRSAVLTR